MSTLPRSPTNFPLNQYGKPFFRSRSGRGVKLTTHFHLLPKNKWIYSPISMVWCWIWRRVSLGLLNPYCQLLQTDSAPCHVILKHFFQAQKLTLRLLMSYIYTELLVKPEMLTSYIYGPTFGNAETVSFYFLHNVSTLNQCREVSCVTFACKHFAS